MKVELVKTFQFEAAHRNPLGDEAAARLHGHSYVVDVVTEGLCDAELGWLVDYGEIASRFQPLFDMLDHRTLEDVEGMTDPTFAGVRAFIAHRLRDCVPHFKDVRLSIVGDLVFRPVALGPSQVEALNERIRFTFEAAHALSRLPETHKCRRMHGHSFRVELAGPDVEDLHSYAFELYVTLDHQSLNDLPGLDNPTSEQLARWIWERVAPQAPDIEAVVVAETCTARCIYRGP